MTEPNHNRSEDPHQRGAIGWLLFPISLFPLVALLTYDWRAIAALQAPPEPSTNWIGALGDRFAYWGYTMFGLAIWLVPVACIVAGLCLIAGRRIRPGRRGAWFLLFLLAASSLVQVLQHHAPGVTSMLESVNTANAGGAAGYLIIDWALAPLISDFGATVIMLIAMAVALVFAIGPSALVRGAAALLKWATNREELEAIPGESDAERDARIEALRAAKEEARRQREEEKQRIREEKQRIKEEKAAAKEAERAAKEAERAAREAEKNAWRNLPPAPPNPGEPPYAQAMPAAPRPAAVPAPQPAAKPAPEKPAEAEKPAEEDKGPYLVPPLSLLNPIPKSSADHGDVTEMSKRLIDTLMLFGVEAKLDYTVQGPVVTKYAVELKPGTKYSAVTNISDNLMGALHAKSLRIEAPIPGEDRIGIEVPNRAAAGISFREIIESDEWKNNVMPAGGKPAKYQLPLLFGKDAAGRNLVADLATMPHMLVAGATGQGKSVCLNAIINGLLMTRTPEQLKFIMVDPKSVEFTAYATLPHLIVPVITENKKVVFSLQWAVVEMEKRLKLFARARCRNIMDFNNRKSFTQTDMFGDDTAVGSDIPRTVPYIVIIIDEVADLMATAAKDVVPSISRLTAKARAAGIHLILATQRPDAKVITGTIKANIPGRVAFKTATAIDSRTILDDAGAENLLGRGDLLFKSKEGILIRAQGAWISDPEIENITSFIQQHANTDFDQRFTRKLGTIKEAETDIFADENENAGGGDAEGGADARATVKAAEDADLYKRALECIINTNRASTSHFQRRLGIGYNHAAKLCDKLEDAGVIGPQKGAGPRDILLTQDQLVAIFNGGDDAAPATASAAQPAAQPTPAAAEPGTDNDNLFTEEEK